jgi:hypothetical protein
MGMNFNEMGGKTFVFVFFLWQFLLFELSVLMTQCFTLHFVLENFDSSSKKKNT